MVCKYTGYNGIFPEQNDHNLGRVGISGDDRITYIPMNGMPNGYTAGDRVLFTFVSNTSAGYMQRGPYKPVEILNISRI